MIAVVGAISRCGTHSRGARLTAGPAPQACVGSLIAPEPPGLVQGNIWLHSRYGAGASGRAACPDPGGDGGRSTGGMSPAIGARSPPVTSGMVPERIFLSPHTQRAGSPGTLLGLYGFGFSAAPALFDAGATALAAAEDLLRGTVRVRPVPNLSRLVVLSTPGRLDRLLFTVLFGTVLFDTVLFGTDDVDTPACLGCRDRLAALSGSW